MSTSKRHLVEKHFRLDSRKLKRAQMVLQAANASEAIELALDFVIAESERDRSAWEANSRFIKNGIEIKDVYGKLSD